MFMEGGMTVRCRETAAVRCYEGCGKHWISCLATAITGTVERRKLDKALLNYSYYVLTS